MNVQPKNHSILIADDELEIRQLLRLYLEKEKFQVFEAENGYQALEVVEKQPIDLVLLDVLMPKMNGYQTLSKLRAINDKPIIFVSAKSNDSEKILGLDLGADDYIAKPFNPLEVISRVSAHLRRYDQLQDKFQGVKTIVIGELTLDTDRCVLQIEEDIVDITATEYKIMKAFMENPHRVFTKQVLCDIGWGVHNPVDDNCIMVCMSKLRAKIKHIKSPMITNIRGLGYRLEI